MAVPADIASLVAARDRARAERDFALADRFREQIEAQGYVVRDTAAGTIVERTPPYEVIDPRAIVDRLADPAEVSVSIHVLHEGFVGDLERFLDGLTAHDELDDAEVVVVDPATGDGPALEQIAARNPSVRILHLDRAPGWAAARNAGLKTSRGALIVIAELSIEPVGELIPPIRAALADPGTVVTGPFGLVTDDLREFREDAGPVVHAIEGYLIATRRPLLAQGLIRERFAWYRNADLDLSFQLRALGGQARTIALPVRKHTHRGWAAVPEAERAGRSRRNHRIFYERWKDRADLSAR